LQDGDQYFGSFKDGKINGEGELFWQNGDHYAGDFVDG